MGLNVKDAEDAFLSGRAEFLEWMEEFTTQWERPGVTTMAAVNLGQLNPVQLAELESLNPEAFADVTRMIEEGRYYGRR